MRQQFETVKGRTPEDKKAFDAALFSWKELLKTTTEDQIKTLLAAGGGKLGKYVVRGPNIEIMWNSESGRGYNSLVNKETFDIVQTGICVSGEDKKFHLKDLAFLVAKGENLHRIHTTRDFDMEGDMDE